MAIFQIQELNRILNSLPLYKSESIKDDLGRGLTNRAYQTLWNLVGGKNGAIINSIFNGGLDGLFGSTYNPDVNLNGVSDDSAMVQTTNVGKDTGAFKWLQGMLTPEMFVSSDSCFIAFGKPTYNENSIGSDFPIVGLCQSLSLSVGVNVITLKELRSERNIVVPLKSTPGSISISRLLTTGANINALTKGGTSWSYDSQTSASKALFGMYIAFMTPGRTADITTLYAERCAITNMGIATNANNFALTESVNIIFDRLKDNVQVSDSELASVMGTTTSTPAPTGILGTAINSVNI